MSSLVITGSDIALIWRNLLVHLLEHGELIAPRNLPCREITGVTIYLEKALNNVLVDPIRNLNYRFMVAEWLFIWFGHDDVKTISRYNKPIAAFSDNGVDFNGAYGPPVVNQWPRILNVLRQDPHTRQAVLLIYRVPNGPTKDVPCTLTMQFFSRGGSLDTVVCMRSSDIWLGLPYDVFNFTMLANILAGQLGLKTGSFTLHLGSSHAYDSDSKEIEEIVSRSRYETSFAKSPQFTGPPQAELDEVLTTLSSDFIFREPWNRYATVLRGTRYSALSELIR